MRGEAGNDVLNGGAGIDAMAGGAGNDIYVVDDAGDTVTEAPNAGTDTVQSAVAFTLGANVENLTLTGAGDVNGTGNTLANILVGNTGVNTLNGGTGADMMFGGGGDDTYFIDNAGDRVVEVAGGGNDGVISSVSHTLAGNVENLTLDRHRRHQRHRQRARQHADRQRRRQHPRRRDGADTLHRHSRQRHPARRCRQRHARRRRGRRRLTGGAGNDTYVVDNVGDRVTEGAGEGTDTVSSSITYTLGANVENLTLTGDRRDQRHRQRREQRAHRQ